MVGEPLVAIAERLQGICLGRRLTVATAESCTGGRVAHAITQVPGSSGYYRGSVVAYADEVKIRLLGVPADVLAAHGAVSAQVAIAMATGARERLGVDLAVAITGVAGPSGGSDDKPVGLTYIAVADGAGTDVRRHQWSGDRRATIEASAAAALEMLVDHADQAT